MTFGQDPVILLSLLFSFDFEENERQSQWLLVWDRSMNIKGESERSTWNLWSMDKKCTLNTQEENEWRGHRRFQLLQKEKKETRGRERGCWWWKKREQDSFLCHVTLLLCQLSLDEDEDADEESIGRSRKRRRSIPTEKGRQELSVSFPHLLSPWCYFIFVSLSSFFMSVVLPLKINGLLSLLVLWCQALFTEDTSLLTCLINDQVLVQMKYDLSLPFFLCFPSALHLLHLKTSCEGNFIFSMSSLLSEEPLSLHLLLSFSRIGRKPRLMSCIERVKRIRDQGCSSFFFLS